jgi:cytochrome c biogenesis protein CcmG/thiol:disulfide interchange protein DsbE
MKKNMSSERARWWITALVLAALVLAGARLERHLHHHVLRTGDRLLPLQVSSLYGTPYTLQPRQRPMIINVFATWCTPCREETPGFAATAQRLRGRGIDVFAIDQQESPQAVSAFVQEFGLRYPVYIDTSGITHDLLGARMIPTTIFVNAAGVIVWEHAGPLTPAQLLAAVGETGGNG